MAEEKAAVQKIFHDINSDLSSLDQAMNLIYENFAKDSNMVEQFLPLTIKKIERLKENWENLKGQVNG